MLLHLYAVRHGQTYFNRYNRLQGWSNSPLTSSGLQDADRAGHKLSQVSFAAAYCSDTTRAQETVHRILDQNQSEKKPEPVSDSHFREQFYGYFEGQDVAMAWWAAGAPHGAGTYQQIVDRFGLAATRDFLKEADPFGDAESDNEYWTRIAGGFALIASDQHLKNDDRVLLISHGNTLLSLVNRFGGGRYDTSSRPSNGSVTIFDFDTDAPFERALQVRSFNR